MSERMKRAYQVVLALLAVFALLNIGYSLLFQFRKADAGYDFKVYWYYGHYIRQGRDLYYPLLQNRETLDLPVRYLDGVVVTQHPVDAADMAMLPVYTAPMLFFISLFSWLSWGRAEPLWYLCNLALMLTAPFLLMRLLPREQRLRPEHAWLVALIVFGMYSARETLEAGQVGFFVLVLMFATFMLMESGGWINLADGRLTLTARGEDRARYVIRRHRLAERLFYDTFGMAEELLDASAGRIEHTLNPGVTEKLCIFLKHPQACPHGSPIPAGDCCVQSESRN